MATFRVRFMGLFMVLLSAYHCMPDNKTVGNDRFNKPLKLSKVITLTPDVSELVRRAGYPGNISYSSFTNQWIFSDSNGTVGLNKTIFLDSFRIKETDTLVNNTKPTYPCLFPFGNQILIIERVTKKVIRIDLTSGHPILIKDSISIPTLKAFSEYYNMNDADNQYFNLNGSICLLANYGLWEERNPNYIDTAVFVVISNNKVLKKIGKYPREYKQMVYKRAAIFRMDHEQNIYYSFEGQDSVYKMNLSGNILARSILHDFPVRKPFNKGKITDLAYVRNYLATNEVNVSMKIIDNRFILIVKQLAQHDVKASKKIKYFVFDKDLNKLYSDTLKNPVFPFAFETRNGFGFLSDSLKKFYEYDLKY